MLIDSHGLQDEATLEADVCIVGAGAAGITLARELEGSGKSVLLLEGGALEERSKQQDLYRGDMLGIRSFELHRVRMRIFGGTTHHWAGWTMPLLAEDFDERSYIPNSGWPLTRSDLDPFYERAAAMVEIGNHSWDTAALAGEKGFPLLTSPTGRMTTRHYKYSPPTRFGSRYRDDISDSLNVTAYYSASLTEVVLNPAFTEVDHLEFTVLGGPSFRVSAAQYVLATGRHRKCAPAPRFACANRRGRRKQQRCGGSVLYGTSPPLQLRRNDVSCRRYRPQHVRALPLEHQRYPGCGWPCAHNRNPLRRGADRLRCNDRRWSRLRRAT
ncbi:MAG: FAD-dependent monooxygenase [Myxococcota bacterium]